MIQLPISACAVNVFTEIIMLALLLMMIECTKQFFPGHPMWRVASCVQSGVGIDGALAEIGISK
jgi:hypothetical protein